MTLRSIGLATSLVLFAFACGSAEKRSGFGTDKDPTVPTTNGGDGSSGSIIGGDEDDDDDDDDDSANPGVPTDQCGINHNPGQDPEKDYDGDGFPLKNDCNECNKKVNKGARDIPGNNIDEDCSGAADDEATSCDDNLDVAPGDAYEAAAAMGLCKRAEKNGIGWGVLDAKFVQADGKKMSGNMLNVGVVPSFGDKNKPKEGQRMFVISTGLARSPKDEGYVEPTDPAGAGGGGGASGMPDGYPKEAPSCSGVPGYTISNEAYDSAGLWVKIRVPSNAKAFSYEHFFLTMEFPDWVCSKYNDFFVTLMDPPPPGLDDANIAFDSQNNPIGVNSGLFRTCKAGDYKVGTGAGEMRHFDCPDGNSRLKGTGKRYEGFTQFPISQKPGGGTGWLTTTSPVTGGQEITLHFTVWDSGDGNLDSTVMLDNFQWSLESAPTVGTTPTGPH
ncbi:MAG: choice-of-anchor L domain-containing protein [Labilithrix sp.]